MTSVYKKLSEARENFHKKVLKKTGENTFAKYKYFELGDFLIPALEVFKDAGLCAVVSFTEALATMTITDMDDASSIVITSPMGSAALKGCHEVQNIGAVETYQRRYLWVAALEIVEHDAVDSSAGADVIVAIDGINKSTSLAALKANFMAAIKMFDAKHHSDITAAKDRRKQELDGAA
jgi:hypothetical protein